jgi:hypothetical protein
VELPPLGAEVPPGPDEAGAEVEEEGADEGVAPPDDPAGVLPAPVFAGVAAFPSALPFSSGFSLLE